MRLSKPLLRVGAGLLVGGGVLVATIVPAFAHPSFGNLPSLPTNTDQPLKLEVPHELADGVYNVNVKVQMPQGFQALECTPQPTWTCVIEQGAQQVVNFTKNAGSAPDRDEDFDFKVRTASTVGSFPFKTLQKYSNGEDRSWSDPPGGEYPAPVVKTTQGTPTTVAPTTNPDKPTTTPPTTKPGTPTTQPPVTNPGGGPVTTKPGATTTAVPGAPTTATTTTTAPGTDPGSTSIPEETTTTPGSSIVSVSGTGTVPGTQPATDRSGTVDASGRPASSPSGGNGPLLGAIGVVVLAGLAGVLVFRKNIFGGAEADPAAAGAGAEPEVIADPGSSEPPPPAPGQ